MNRRDAICRRDAINRVSTMYNLNEVVMKLFSIEELAILTALGNTDCVSIYMPTFKMSTETLQMILISLIFVSQTTTNAE
ncbi:hypothetical protein CAL7716_098020 [Calothrix sp. PCC 7716]|nr:hypothetical protein CAL7716_098020 [Calothrix sp. PCC 7716]